MRRTAEPSLIDGQTDAAASAMPVKPYLALFDNLPCPAWVMDAETCRVLEVNPFASTTLGYSREEFTSMAFTELLPFEQVAQFKEALAVADSEFHSQGLCTQRRKDGSMLMVELKWTRFHFHGRPAVILLSNEVTNVNRCDDRAAVFSDLGRLLSSSSTAKEAAWAIVNAADKLFGWDSCLVELWNEGTKRLSTVLAVDTIAGNRQEIELQSKQLGPITHQALRHGGVLVLRPRLEHLPPGAVPFGDKSRPSLSLITVPVQVDNRVIALVSIQSYTLNAYTDDDLQVLRALADHCGGALERIRIEQEIARLHGELRSHLEELQTIFDVAPVGIAVAHDPECRHVSVNSTCASVLGLEGVEDLGQFNLAGEPLPFSVKVDGRELEPQEWPMRCAALTGRVVSGREFTLTFMDGRSVSCYACASPLYDEDGNVRGSLGIFLDLTARKTAEQEILRLNAELEKRVRDRTNQLQAINSELEAFSYSVSHDLRAPLRSIRGFSEVLLERYLDQLDSRGQEFLKRICGSCTQMEKLIDDLLKLSRVGRSELVARDIDLTAMAESIIGDLCKSEPNRTVKFFAQQNLKVHGDERLLRVALENLLRNSWKFTRKEPAPVIEFGQTQEPDPAFYVRDNGAGFDMTYASRLFGVFQRLHTASEFPGTGVGLATVQRIIARHGGRVWAHGEVNRGATFYFNLPADGSA